MRKKLSTANNMLQKLYHNCTYKAEEIRSLNEFFLDHLSLEVEEGTGWSDGFRKSYKQSTNLVYGLVI